MRNAEVKARVGRGSCHWWDVTNDGSRGGGGVEGIVLILRACRDSHRDPPRRAVTWRVGGKIRETAPTWREKKGPEIKQNPPKKRKRGSTCFNFFSAVRRRTQQEGVGGCQSGTGASSVCHLSLSRSLLSLFPSISLFCTPLSCCFWLLVGVQQRQTNRGGCLCAPAGNNSALLTLRYLALGSLNPLIYHGERGVMISSSLGTSASHSGV